jgi:hypothetical protein
MQSAAPARPDSRVAADDWFSRGRLLLLLGGFVIVAFPTVVIGTHSFFYRDMVQFGYPLAHFHREAFWRGEMPFWNSYNNCGLPFLAQWNTLVLYPGSLIYLLLPLPWSMNLFVLVHLFVAASGMYTLARQWTGSPFGACVAALVFSWNGFTLHSLMWPNNIAAFGWMSWLVWSLDRAVREGTGRNIVVAAVFGCLQMLAGAPEIILLTWITAGVLALREAALERHWRQVFRSLGSAWLLTIVMSSAQLLPFLELLRASQRDAGFAGTQWPMPLWGWANFFVPLFGQTPSLNNVYSQDDQQWTSSYYLGVATLLLAALAIVQRPARSFWLLGLAAAGVLMALGEPGGVYKAVNTLVPALGFIRFPIKYVVLTLFAVPILAAAGIAAWQNRAKRSATMPVGLALGIIAIVLGVMAWSRFSPVGGADPKTVLWSGASRLLFLGAAVVCLLMLHRVGTSGIVLRVALLMLLGADTFTHAPRQNPVVPNLGYEPMSVGINPKPVLGESRAMISPSMQRLLENIANEDPYQLVRGYRRMLLSNCNLLDDVPKVNGFYALYIRHAHDVLRRLYSSPADVSRLPLLDFLGVSQLSAPQELFAWVHRETAMPLVSAGQRPSFADGTNALEALFSSAFAPRTQIVLPTEARHLVSHSNACEVLKFTVEPQSVEARVRASGPALVVIAQAHFSGWQATLNGKPVPVIRANHAFQAVPIPGGEHILKLRYRDRLFLPGAVLSLVGIAICACLWGRPSSEMMRQN